MNGGAMKKMVLLLLGFLSVQVMAGNLQLVPFGGGDIGAIISTENPQSMFVETVYNESLGTAILHAFLCSSVCHVIQPPVCLRFQVVDHLFTRDGIPQPVAVSCSVLCFTQDDVDEAVRLATQNGVFNPLYFMFAFLLTFNAPERAAVIEPGFDYVYEMGLGNDRLQRGTNYVMISLGVQGGGIINLWQDIVLIRIVVI